MPFKKWTTICIHLRAQFAHMANTELFKKNNMRQGEKKGVEVMLTGAMIAVRCTESNEGHFRAMVTRRKEYS